MSLDFWRNSRVAVIGCGSWGTVLANLASQNCENVTVWTRNEEHAREINSTRENARYLPEFKLGQNLKVVSNFERLFESPPHAIVWGLPAKATRPQAAQLAKHLSGEEILIHATKGVEEGTLKRISEVLGEELPIRRIGVVSGPNLAKEVAAGQPSATVVASVFPEVIDCGRALFETDQFKVYSEEDIVGVEWAGTLKNILAIASGSLDALGLGWNTRSFLITRGLAEFVRFGVAMGGKEMTFLGLAGMGDLLATCSSPLSRNYRVGYEIAKGKPLEEVLKTLGQTAEGVKTVESVYRFAESRQIEMPITSTVHQMLEGKFDVQTALNHLLSRPKVEK